MKWSSYIGFDEACQGGYYHTWQSALDCINDKRVVDIAWLDRIEGDDHEVINVVYLKPNGEKDTFNILIQDGEGEFHEQELRKWMANHPTKVWKGNHPGYAIRGINY